MLGQTIGFRIHRSIKVREGDLDENREDVLDIFDDTEDFLYLHVVCYSSDERCVVREVSPKFSAERRADWRAIASVIRGELTMSFVVAPCSMLDPVESIRIQASLALFD